MILEKLKLFCKLSAASLFLDADQSVKHEKTHNLSESIKQAEEIEQYGIPGIVLGVNVNGVNVLVKGYGYSDVENLVKCNSQTVMRIASISKPITMTILAKLLELKSLSLDVPIGSYLTKFPQKYFDNDMVNINLRNIVSHLSGIRHYDKECREIKTAVEPNKKDSSKKETSKEFDFAEYYLASPYASVDEAINIFANDPLCAKPGSKFLYTTHGWTLIAGAIERATKESFVKTLKQFFQGLGMDSTYLDENSPLISNRSRYYVREGATKDSSNYVIKNCKYVDNSYKWAGGGILSTVPDLITFGLTMLYSYQNCNDPTRNAEGQTPGGYLDCQTVAQLWTPIVKTPYKSPYVSHYGMGWFVYNPNHPNGIEDEKDGDKINIPALYDCQSCSPKNFACFHHTGGAVGASSILAIFTKPAANNTASVTLNHESTDLQGKSVARPGVEGVVVCLLTNLQGVSLTKAAFDIGKLFVNQ